MHTDHWVVQAVACSSASPVAVQQHLQQLPHGQCCRGREGLGYRWLSVLGTDGGAVVVASVGTPQHARMAG